jgi:hypothetical protein
MIIDQKAIENPVKPTLPKTKNQNNKDSQNTCKEYDTFGVDVIGLPNVDIF